MRKTCRRHAPYTKLKALLDERGISQKELAAKLGKSPSALNQNLNGTGGDFSLAEARLICSLLEISMDDYFLCPEVSKMKQLPQCCLHSTAAFADGSENGAVCSRPTDCGKRMDGKI